eukprot:120149_1
MGSIKYLFNCLLFVRIIKTQNSRSFLPLLSPGFHMGIPYDTTNPNQTQKDITDSAFYNEILASAKNPGMDIYQLGFTWLDYEAIPNEIDSTQTETFFNIVNNTLNCQPLVGISIINTNVLSIPNDLINNNMLSNGMLFNSTTFLNRYFAVLNDAIPKIIENRGFYVVLANEFNGYSNLFNVPGYAESFVDFVEKSMEYIHITLGYNDLAVGVTVMHNGLIDLVGQLWYDRLMNVVDIMSVTYYPLQSNFNVEDPFIVEQGFQEILNNIPSNMAIVLQEFGYPSGYLNDPNNDSSQQKQAAFYRNMFHQFLTTDAVNSRLRVASVFKMVDWSSSACNGYGSYYGISDDAFLEYLCSLGLYTYEGVEKEAYQVVLKGFNNLESFRDISTTKMPTYQPSVSPNIDGETRNPTDSPMDCDDDCSNNGTAVYVLNVIVYIIIMLFVETFLF